MSAFKFHASNYLNLKLWAKLIGSSPQFSLESRIFHSISVSLIVLVSIYVPYNFFAGLYVASISALIVGLFFAYQYYQSRFLGKKHSSVFFGAMGIIMFGINYFFTSGINGSTDLIWPVYLLLVLAISPYQHQFKWLIAYILFFIIIHYLEFKFPGWVEHPFIAGKGQFIDRVTVFPIPAIAIYIIITFIRKSYDKEKKIAEEKTIAIAASTEQILIQKAQLELSNLEKNKLMSIVSHDLRAPLGNIQNYLELLNQYELDSTERKGLEKILLLETNNTMIMLSNLLSWSKSQMDGLIVNLKSINLLETLSATLEMEIIHAAKKEITLSYHISPKIEVMADTDMLQIVIRNLISNAIKFTPKGEFIFIEAAIIGQECLITVKDGGIGIPLDKQCKIFTIKTQPEYGTNNEKGVGLGLSLCKEFTERQGGSIKFESEVGKGSSFFVYMPIGA